MRYKIVKYPIISSPSPNFSERDDTPIDMLILHYTAVDFKTSMQILHDPEKQASSHYLIDRDGTIYQLVADDKKAWHAGVSEWRGRKNLNLNSIGIEIVNSGYEPFEKKQIAALIYLLSRLTRRYHIKKTDILGHMDVAPNRKIDPGQFFPWKTIAKKGFGIWPQTGTSRRLLTKEEAIIKLTQIGYGLNFDPDQDVALKTVLRSFQRHYLPHNITGRLDRKTSRVILNLLESLNKVR